MEQKRVGISIYQKVKDLTNILRLLYLCVAVDQSLHAQPDPVMAFNTVLRDFDLNADMQDGYAITVVEYGRLRTAWQNLTPADKLQLHGIEHNYWDEIYITKLLRDLIAGTSWEQHVEKMMQLGARGLALTLSRYRSHITVTEARNNLADLLYKGPSMFTHGEFQIPEDIKAAARARVGDKAAQRLEKWEHMINALQHSGVWEKMEAVNKFINHAITASTDRGTALGYDYWQSPIETLVRGKGDCDDFAVAKYVSLRMLGIPAEQLRLSVVMQPEVGHHGVLLIFLPYETDQYVLDNLGSTRLGSEADAILRLRARRNVDGMKPLWGMNEKLLTRFQDDLSEERISSYPYQKFPAVALTFINSYRLLPKSAWAQCDKGYECICPRVGIHEGGADTSARVINFEEN
jgi:predicted transglutaminase-like cysteine proteinase